MPIEVTCAQCGKTLKAPDGLAGKKAKCPGCNTVLVVPEAPEEIFDAEIIEPMAPQAEKYSGLGNLLDEDQGHRVQANPVGQTGAGEESRRPCPACGELIAIGAGKCRFCNEFFDANLRRRERQSRGSRGAHRSGEKLAPRLNRLAAVILDSLVAMVAFAPGTIAFAMLGDGPGRAEDLSVGGVIGVLLSAIGLLCLVIYQLFLLSTQGQTIGKKLLKIRIVKMDDGSNPGFVGAVLLRAFVPGLLGCLPCCVGPIFTLADYVCIFGEERRCIHDQFAGTIVIEA